MADFKLIREMVSYVLDQQCPVTNCEDGTPFFNGGHNQITNSQFMVSYSDHEDNRIF